MAGTAWHVVGHSLTGTDHQKSDQPCEDAHSLRVDGEMLAMAVSDGASSEAHGGAAAALTASLLTERLLGLLSNGGTVPSNADADIWREIMQDAHEALHKAAEDDGSDWKSWACTAIACLASPERAVLIHIGDGFGYISGSAQQGEAHPFVFSAPENGRSDQYTYFLCDANWRDHCRVSILANPTMIVLGSDGARFTLNKDRTNVFQDLVHDMNEIMFSRIETPERRAEFLHNIMQRYAKYAYGDDLTLAWAGLTHIS